MTAGQLVRVYMINKSCLQNRDRVEIEKDIGACK